MFDTLRAPEHIVSVMMLRVILKDNMAPFSLHVLSMHVAHWLVGIGIFQCHSTHVAKTNWYCEIVMQDITVALHHILTTRLYSVASIVGNYQELAGNFASEYDLLQAAYGIMAKHQMVETPKHVKSHQDTIAYDELPWQAKLNCDCDQS